jgi:hypothetical protein
MFGMVELARRAYANPDGPCLSIPRPCPAIRLWVRGMRRGQPFVRCAEPRPNLRGWRHGRGAASHDRRGEYPCRGSGGGEQQESEGIAA